MTDSTTGANAGGSERLEALSLRSLGYAAGYAAQVANALRKTSALLRTGEIERANDLYAHVIDALSVLIFTISSSVENLGDEAAALQDVDAALAPWLQELEEAQRREDWICVADCLEHEVAPVVDEWSESMAGVLPVTDGHLQ